MRLGLAKISHITVCGQFHADCVVCDDSVILRCYVIKELLHLFQGVFGWFTDWEAMALIEYSSELTNTLPRKRNSLHTFWMWRLPFASNGGAVDVCVAYCFLVTYWMGMLWYGTFFCFDVMTC